MKVTIYELLGMIKDCKPPKRIIYDQYVYVWTKEDENYTRENSIGTSLNWDYIVINCLNEPVEILEEEKKIPERLYNYISCGWNGTCKDLKREELFGDLKQIGSKINEIIDYLKSKGE